MIYIRQGEGEAAAVVTLVPSLDADQTKSYHLWMETLCTVGGVVIKLWEA